MKYIIRVLKYIVYFYAFFVLLYLCMDLFSGEMSTLAADLATLTQPRMLIGIGLISLLYPLIGFLSVSEPLPAGENQLQALCTIMSNYGYKLSRSDGNTHVFRAISPARRLFAAFEDAVTLTFEPSGALTISGLRKDVAKVRLRVKDYVRRGL
jgi:hypothetical protein